MTIRNHHPSLAIRAYHLKEDLIRIPQYIAKFNQENEGYSLYLRYDNYFSRSLDETTIYAVWEKKDAK